MKFKIFLALVFLLTSTTVYAELSSVNKQRVGKGMLECKEDNNELIYKDYWKDSVKPENLKSVCMAERFADQVAAEGEIWLENEAVELIYLCSDNPENRKSFFSCMRTRLDEVAEGLGEPCVELGSEKLWSEDKCKRLVSYIFLNKFNRIFASLDRPVRTGQSSVKPIESKLSLTSTWRIEQAVRRCDQSNNELIYKEYWRDSTKPENQETVCIAEQFAVQVAADGDGWIETSAEKLIEECEKQGWNNEKIYFLCLKRNLEKNAKILFSPCKELGEKKLWDQRKCEHLVSYIFMANFDDAVKSSMPLGEKIMLTFDRLSKKTWINFFINPVTAIFVFILFVLDIVFLVEKGTWMRVTKIGLIIGVLLIIASFTKGGLRIFLSGFTIIVIFSIIGWNHRVVKKKSKKKKPIPIEF